MRQIMPYTTKFEVILRFMPACPPGRQACNDDAAAAAASADDRTWCDAGMIMSRHASNHQIIADDSYLFAAQSGSR